MNMQLKSILFFAFFLTMQLGAQIRPSYDPNSILQGISFSNVRFGVKISPDISWLSVQNNDLQADGATLKYGLGFVAMYEVNPLLSVITGINYNTMGGYVFDSLSLNTITNKDNYRINYTMIEVPLGIKVQTQAINRISYYLQGGISTGFVITANEKYVSTLPNTDLPPVDIIHLTSTSVAGCFFGIGTAYKIAGNIELFGELNYKTSLTNIANADEYANDRTRNYTSPVRIFPACMEFSVGLMF